ncbi:MAG TPA: sugar ABC transporter permease [Symbiobacteriaceae bacterium]|nr:sugar ABC transporter permease [Symbiobacteriaceae bacterium]
MKASTLKLRRHGFELLLLLPLAAYVFGFTLLPVIRSITYGFTNAAGSFTLENYRTMFANTQFLTAVRNTLAVTAVGLTLEMSVGLALAMILTRDFKLRGLFRSLMMIPMGVPTIVSGVTLMYVFDTSGYLNELLFRLGLIHLPIDWATGGLRTLFMVVIADMWKVTPIVVLLMLAGLESIPEELYEAAAVDGATGWRAFWRVTLPLLKPAITMTVILRGVDTFRIFELPLILAGRVNPVLATFAYTEYNNYHNNHTSGAAASFLMGMIMICVVAYLLLVERERRAKV